MKIFFLGNDDGNYPGFAFQCKTALEKLNHEVIYFNYRTFKLNHFKISNLLLNKIILNKILDSNPDILMVNKGESLLPGIIKKISREGIKSVNWALDDPFGRYELFNKISNISEYDHFFVFDSSYVGSLKKINPNTHYLPVAADPFNVHKVIVPLNKRKYRYDISFVGSYEKDREKIFLNLLNFDFNLWGPIWNKKLNLKLKPFFHNKSINGASMARVFNETKINLNIQAPHGINSMNLKTFEIPSTKSFQLCDYRKDLPSLFKVGKEIITYTSIEDMKDQIKYFLDNPLERDKISEAGYKRVIKDHTMLNRMKEMLSKIK